jgi:hypothetical protein
MMDYGGDERRKTKKDLKRKRLARAYKRGGQFRTNEVSETHLEEEKIKDFNKKKNRKKK